MCRSGVLSQHIWAELHKGATFRIGDSCRRDEIGGTAEIGGNTMNAQRPALRLVHGALDAPAVEWAWFCGHCAASAPGGAAPPPAARVCRSCGLGLLLETRRDILPAVRDAFLVVDAHLLVQAMS